MLVIAWAVADMRIIDKSFTKAPKNYIFQSLLATIAVAVVLYFVEILTHAAIVAALGASTFIIFAMPHSITAQPRRLIGGQVVGLLCGLLCYYIFITGPLGAVFANGGFTAWVGCAVAVGLSIFIMTITNTEHPPAAGTALGIVTHEWTFQTIIFILLFAISLAIITIIRRLFRSQLKDLF